MSRKLIDFSQLNDNIRSGNPSQPTNIQAPFTQENYCLQKKGQTEKRVSLKF